MELPIVGSRWGRVELSVSADAYKRSTSRARAVFQIPRHTQDWNSRMFPSVRGSPRGRAEKGGSRVPFRARSSGNGSSQERGS